MTDKDIRGNGMLVVLLSEDEWQGKAQRPMPLVQREKIVLYQYEFTDDTAFFSWLRQGSMDYLAGTYWLH